MGRLFSLTIFIFGLLIVVALYKDIIPFYSGDKNAMFYSLWKQDLEKLMEYKKLPYEFGEIEKIEYFPLSDNTRVLLEKIKAPIKVNPKGKFTLQITFDDWHDEKGHGYLIQYNLLNSSTKNNIWELGRTLSFDATPKIVSQNKKESHQPPPAVSPSKSLAQPAPH